MSRRGLWLTHTGASQSPPVLGGYSPSHRHPAVPTCSLGKPGPILGSATTGAARSAVGGSFPTCLAEHRARATGFRLWHRPHELLFNNRGTRALYDQDVRLLEAWVCLRVRIKVVEGGFRDSSARSGMQGSGTVESLDQQHKASRGRFSIGDGHGFKSILRGTMEFERKPISKHLDVEIISGMLMLVVREIVRPRRSCRSGRSPEACSRSAARSRSANCWVTTAHNGRRCSRRRCSRRVLSGQSDMKGCRPARVASKTTPWRSIGCIDPRGSPAGGAASAPRGIFLRRSTCKRTETQPGRPPEEKPKAPERC